MSVTCVDMSVSLQMHKPGGYSLQVPVARGTLQYVPPGASHPVPAPHWAECQAVVVAVLCLLIVSFMIIAFAFPFDISDQY